MKPETAPELDLYEAVFLRSKSYSLSIKQYSSHCKHKGVQDHNKHALEDYKYRLENNESKNGDNYSLRVINMKLQWLNKKIALNNFDDKRCYIDKYITVPWGYIPSSKMTQKSVEIFINKFIQIHQKRIMLQTKLMFIILMTFGV